MYRVLLSPHRATPWSISVAESRTPGLQGHGLFNRAPWLDRTIELAGPFLTRYNYTQGKPTIDIPGVSKMEMQAVRETHV